MILLERLTVRELGGLHRVDLEFQPQGQHLITVPPDQAHALQAALSTCLYGPPDGMRARSDGAMVECALAAGGRPLTVRRTLRAAGADEAELLINRGPRSTPIHGEAQVRAALDRMLGLDRATLELLVRPEPRFELPPAAEIRALLRRLLGERRIQEMEVEFAESPALLEEEAVARARVELAQAVARASANENEIDRLDRALQRWRVRQALQALTAASERASEADAAERRYRVLRGQFLDERDRLAAYRELASLWADQARYAAEAARAREHIGRLDARLGDLASLAQRARTGAERLAALDQACDAATAGAAASEAADRARTKLDHHHRTAHELRQARSNLVEAEVVQAKAQAGAERARTLRKRAHEDEHLPAAHRLWGRLADTLLAEPEHAGDEVDPLSSRARPLASGRTYGRWPSKLSAAETA